MLIDGALICRLNQDKDNIMIGTQDIIVSTIVRHLVMLVFDQKIFTLHTISARLRTSSLFNRLKLTYIKHQRIAEILVSWRRRIKLEHDKGWIQMNSAHAMLNSKYCTITSPLA